MKPPIKKRYLYERPADDRRPGDVDAMSGLVDLADGDDEPFRMSDAEIIRQRLQADERHKPPVEMAPWLKAKTQI